MPLELDELLDSLSAPAPSDLERAQSLTVVCLAAATGVHPSKND